MRNMQKPAGRPKQFPVKKVVGFERETLAAIEAWCRKHDPAPNVSQAIRDLIEIGLAASKDTLPK